MKDFDAYLEEIGEIGYVQSIVSSIFYVSGLPNARLNELVIAENGMIGIVRSVLADLVEVMIFEGQNLGHNMKVVRTNEYFQVPVSDEFLGRVIDPFGITQDSGEPIAQEKLFFREVDPPAPSLFQRAKISKNMETGVMIVDLLVPLGIGQRELILGDPKTGKTMFCLQAMVNQVRAGAIGIYVSCGKKKSDLKFTESFFKGAKVMEKLVIIAASSSDPAPMVYLAPFSAMSVAEHFRDKGNNVLVVVDDLTMHAKFYREISLLTKRPPGRQSYPGDIFHVHAKIAERAGNIRLADGKEAAITLLPIAETLEGDLTGYIQTNLMAMTDGHIFFDVAEAKRGKLPAISYTLSVSRVGNQTRTPLEREIATKLIFWLNETGKAEELGKFGVELSEETMKALQVSRQLEGLFVQDPGMIYPKGLQILFVGLFLTNFWQGVSSSELTRQKKVLYDAYIAGSLDKVKLKINKANALSELMTILNSEAAALKKLLEVKKK